VAERVPEEVGGVEMARGVSAQELREDLMVLNMGPQHPSTHGVLRLLLTLDGEEVVDCRPIVGYLHTGIEKNTEYRTWQQAVTFVTRADYLSPFFNELAGPGDPGPGV
jgi:NADH-quinone oxidoreductase subunit D